MCEVVRERNMSHAVPINTHTLHFCVIFKFSVFKKETQRCIFILSRGQQVFSLKKEISV